MLRYSLLLLGAIFFHVHISFAQQPETKVTLGIKPDYMYTLKGKGVRVNGLVEGKLAQSVGIKEGDIITAFNGEDIKDIFEYKSQLEKISPGDKVKVTISRNGQVIAIPVWFK